MEPKVLLLTASVGAGHVRAAQAVAETLAYEYPQAQVRVVDIMDGKDGPWRQWVKEGYYTLVQHLPSLYDWLYRWSDEQAAVPQVAEYALRFSVGALLREQQPDVVVAAHPFAASAAGYWLKRQHAAASLGTVVTDYGAHRLWTHPGVDCYFVATETVRQQLLHYGVDDRRIAISGIPISRAFYPATDKAAIRRSLCLESDLPTVVFMGGGIGLGPVLACLEDFEKTEGMRRQLVVLAGRNVQLYMAARQAAKGSRHHIAVRGFTRRVAEYLRAADVLVTKPGGMTLSEAAATGLPMVLLPPLPGQEEDNARFFEANGGAVYCRDSRECHAAVQVVLSEQGAGQFWQRRLLAAAKPDAARHIADWAMRMAQQRRNLAVGTSAV